MEITTEHTTKSRIHRSKVSNGKLLPLVDGRSALARRFRDLIEDVINDLGGRDALSEAERQIIRRACLISAESERMEAEWAAGKPFDLLASATASNSMRRLFETLGLQRRGRDVTPSLQGYLNTKGAP
jgi:hypothetical protein